MQGIPVVISSDNGPPFMSSEFELYMTEIGVTVKHQRITQLWPQANSSENFMKPLIKTIHAAQTEKKGWKKNSTELESHSPFDNLISTYRFIVYLNNLHKATSENNCWQQKGTMITTPQNGKYITRNASLFKKSELKLFRMGERRN